MVFREWNRTEKTKTNGQLNRWWLNDTHGSAANNTVNIADVTSFDDSNDDDANDNDDDAVDAL